MKWALFDVQEILLFLYFNSPNLKFSCLPKFNCFPPGLLPGCWVGLSDDNYLLWAPLLLLGPSITGICTFPPLSHNVELCPWCCMYCPIQCGGIISEVCSLLTSTCKNGSLRWPISMGLKCLQWQIFGMTKITGICTFPPLSHNVELCPWCCMYCAI